MNNESSDPNRVASPMKSSQKIIKIREILKVPENQRIAQFIYNQFRNYEDAIEIMIKEDGDFVSERSLRGIDIFHVEDEEFIKGISKKL